tara:strand:- start:342 stop:1634 length:1293 start_codon:yes stop_codon:yes gene_type:complete
MALTQIPPVMIDGEFGLDWQSSVGTSNFTAVVAKGYFVNTTSGDITVTLPTSPTVGNSVGIMDYAGTTSTNKIILTSSNNIQGSSDNKAIRYNRGTIRITYSGTTQGWIVSAAANEGTSALRPPIDLLHYLVVAGGGGGGQYAGSGGGGAGGLRTSWPGGSGGGQASETVLNLALGINYAITVGLGGAGGIGASQSVNGTNSSISHSSITDIISTGGGSGGGYANGFYSPQQGGSGGGGTYAYAANMPGAAAVTSPVVQGYAGGNGWNSSSSNGGGGGGAGAAGQTGTNFVGADGGIGLQSDITGAATYYAGGGGGGLYPYNASYPRGDGGDGGGGNGGIGDPPTGFLATDGSPNTGGGGGGSGSSNQNNAAGTGGSGIVILRCTLATATLGSGITVNSTTGPGTVNGVAITGTDDYYYSATAGTGTITF